MLTASIFSELQITHIWSDNPLQIGGHIFERAITKFCGDEANEVDKVLICNLFSYKYIKQDLEGIGFSDKIISFF